MEIITIIKWICIVIVILLAVGFVFAFFVGWFYHPFMAVLAVVKWICIVITILLAGGFVFALYKGWSYHPRYELEKRKAKKIFTLRDAVTKEHWESIVRKFSLGTPEAARAAVIEADALADTVLKSMEIPGTHLADRLSNLEPEEVASLDRVWRAHRTRNDLVHTPGFALTAKEAQKTLEDYEAFLKDLGVL
ncbi:MAG: hypothetical protein ABSE18_01850 [Minisyncoccia bacterium]|jgi:hypothetical protein